LELVTRTHARTHTRVHDAILQQLKRQSSLCMKRSGVRLPPANWANCIILHSSGQPSRLPLGVCGARAWHSSTNHKRCVHDLFHSTLFSCSCLGRPHFLHIYFLVTFFFTYDGLDPVTYFNSELNLKLWFLSHLVGRGISTSETYRVRRNYTGQHDTAKRGHTSTFRPIYLLYFKK